MSTGTILATPVGKILFNRLEEPASFKDDPELPKKYTASVEFDGEAAKSLRLQLIELGKATKLVDGKLKVNFSRQEKAGRPVMVDKNKLDILDRPNFIPNGTDVRVSFMAREAPMGVYLVLEGVMVVGDMAEQRPAQKSVTVTEVVSPEFLDVF